MRLLITVYSETKNTNCVRNKWLVEMENQLTIKFEIYMFRPAKTYFNYVSEITC